MTKRKSAKPSAKTQPPAKPKATSAKPKPKSSAQPQSQKPAAPSVEAAEPAESAPPPLRKPFVWESVEEPDEEEHELPLRGGVAVQHQPDQTRGRRSALFPDLNITETATRLRITKSHLAKILNGYNRPSIELALRLSEVLGKDLLFVASLYNNESVASSNKANTKPNKKPTRKRK